MDVGTPIDIEPAPWREMTEAAGSLLDRAMQVPGAECDHDDARSKIVTALHVGISALLNDAQHRIVAIDGAGPVIVFNLAEVVAFTAGVTLAQAGAFRDPNRALQRLAAKVNEGFAEGSR